jgi:outer membrane protein assembly factor BamE (lipoprotein component of BamABCDE complex)
LFDMKSALFTVPAIAAAVMLSGCAGVLAHKGAVIDNQLVAAVTPGVDNKASVEKVLGRPTFTGQFNPNDWYYVSRDTKQIAFRNPRPTRGSVLLVRFDQAGNVASISRSGRELMASIDPSGRRTPTLGRERGFFDELFGNISTVGSPLPTSR